MKHETAARCGGGGGCCGGCGGCAGCDTGDTKGHGCAHDGCGRCCGKREITISEPERDFLLLLGQIPFLPLARFVKKSADPSLPDETALAPVYLSTPDDSTETVRETGLVLQALESKRLITLDYDQPLSNFDYSPYEASALYKEFSAAANGGSHQGESAFLPVLEHGSIALTSLGQSALDSLEP